MHSLCLRRGMTCSSCLTVSALSVSCNSAIIASYPYYPSWILRVVLNDSISSTIRFARLARAHYLLVAVLKALFKILTGAKELQEQSALT